MSAPRQIVLATPAYDGRTVVGFTKALADSIVRLAGAGVISEWIAWPGDPYVGQARNRLVKRFLDSKADELIFLDSDVVWRADALLQLLSHDVALVGGVYRYKVPQEAYPVRFVLNESGQPQRAAGTGLIECEWLPTGFLRIRREVFTDMLGHYGREAMMVVQDDALDREVDRYYNFFETRTRNHSFVGEDVEFCRRWREELGGQVWCDPDLDLTHVGGLSFKGNLGRWLDSQHRLLPAAKANGGAEVRP